MNTLPQFLLRLIDSNRHGGRTIRTDESTVVLYDCGVWTDAHTNAVRARCPECDITITQSQASLSGFIVMFKVHTDKTFYTWAGALAGVFVLLFITARQIVVAEL